MIIRVLRVKRLLLLLLILLVIVVLLIGYSKPFLKMLYPIPYKDEINKFAQQFGLDPLLVTAVIRTESKFDPEARSSKGAVGLMQLMPETARWAAGKMGIEYSKTNLFDPEANILIGCWYLSLLKHQFNGNFVAALAAYNGGRTFVNQWLNEKQWDGSYEDIDNIPFPETREYVKRVIRNYKIYQRIYEDRGGGLFGVKTAEES